MASVVRMSLVHTQRSLSAFPFGLLCSTAGILFGKIWRLGEIITGRVRLKETTVGSWSPTSLPQQCHPRAHGKRIVFRWFWNVPSERDSTLFLDKGKGKRVVMDSTYQLPPSASNRTTHVTGKEQCSANRHSTMICLSQP